MGKPRLVVLGTGGTIAGAAVSKTDMTGYVSGEISITQILQSVPELQQVARIRAEQICNLESADLTHAIWLELSRRVNTLLAQDDVDGVIITHGTDTLEETAFFLHLTVQSPKPVVFVGAMRPATAISADGPLNLLNAAVLAGSPLARGKGVLVAMNDQINGAREVTKTNTTHVDAFKSGDFGYLGYFRDGVPVLYTQSTRRHTWQSEFSIDKVQELPRVDIVYLHVHCDDVLLRAARSAGAQGLVVAGLGNGTLPVRVVKTLAEMSKEGVVIVRGSRVANGGVSKSKQDALYGFVEPDNLNLQKARILLMLSLLQTRDAREVQRYFDNY